MKPTRILRICLGWGCAAVALPVATAAEATFEALVEQSTAALAGKDWERALELNNRAIGDFGGGDGLRRYGPQFGTIYYRKGLCEIKLRQWSAALSSFETCYRDFPNPPGRRDNPYQILALLKGGEAAMGAEDWALAASKFSKFAAERDLTLDRFPQGSFYINLAVCHYRLGRIAEGNENLEIALANRLDFPTPDSGILAGFQAMVTAALAKRDEQMLLDSLGKNRGELTVGAAEMARTASVFLKLAGDALGAGMTRAAIALYQFVPSSGDATADPEVAKLAGMALIHEKAGNLRGAVAAYRQLVRDFPQAANREDYFYHLVRTSSLLGPAALYADGFLHEFPSSTRAAEVRFCASESPETSPIWPAPRQPADPSPAPAPLPDSRPFALALDLFQGRKYRDAQAAFAKISTTPDSQTRALAAFYQAECFRRCGDFPALATALESQQNPATLGGERLRQLEIDQIYQAVAKKDWPAVAARTGRYETVVLPADQRAQVAWCQAVVSESQQQPEAALDFYNEAMTANAGGCEDLTRRAALAALQILCNDPAVQAALKSPKNPALEKLREATALANLFELSLGSGAPLPQKFRVFLPTPDRK